MLRGKCIGLNVYIRKERRCKNSDLNFYIKNLENEEQVKTKVSKGEEVKISGQEKKKRKQTSEKLMKSKDGCLKRIL